MAARHRLRRAGGARRARAAGAARPRPRLARVLLAGRPRRGPAAHRRARSAVGACAGGARLLRVPRRDLARRELTGAAAGALAASCPPALPPPLPPLLPSRPCLPPPLPALLDSLRVQGEREHQLSKTLTELQPLLVAAMQRDAATTAAGGVVADGSPPAEVEELPTTNGGDGSGMGGAEEDAESPEQAGEVGEVAAAAATTTASGGDGVDGAAVAAALASPTWSLWETGGWQSRATKHIERTLSESTRRGHRDSGGAGDAAAPRVGRA
eukprot:scaffold12824_cov41-Phaeocystis_antarctica.AAC.1